MRIVRAVAALWLIVGTLAFRPAFSRARALELYAFYPELTIFTLVIDSLPIVLGLAWLARDRGLVADRQEESLRLASRAATFLNVAGLLMPLHASNAAAGFEELLYRGAVFVALVFGLDGRVSRSKHPSKEGPRSR